MAETVHSSDICTIFQQNRHSILTTIFATQNQCCPVQTWNTYSLWQAMMMHSIRHHSKFWTVRQSALNNKQIKDQIVRNMDVIFTYSVCLWLWCHFLGQAAADRCVDDTSEWQAPMGFDHPTKHHHTLTCVFTWGTLQNTLWMKLHYQTF